MNFTRLTYCSPQNKFKIKDFYGGKGAKENLKSLGLNVGDEIIFKSKKNGHGKLVLEFNAHEVSLGYELASKIIVETQSEQIITLDKVKIGDTVEVTKMGATGDIRFRLLDMGLVKGVQLRVIRSAPLGDPIEVLINEFNLSLRLEEAKNIEVKIVELEKAHHSKRNWGIFR